MVKEFKPGEKVKWKWMGGHVKGEVVDIYFEPVRKVIKGKTIKRNGSKQNPAYLVMSSSGNFALKLGSELEGDIETLKAKRPDKPI